MRSFSFSFGFIFDDFCSRCEQFPFVWYEILNENLRIAKEKYNKKYQNKHIAYTDYRA